MILKNKDYEKNIYGFPSGGSIIQYYVTGS
jgi:hypothetical protein